MSARQENILSGLSESAKEKVAAEIKKAVNRQVKKELAKRRKKFARKLLMTGAVFACGCVIYFGSDKLVDLLTDQAWNASRKKAAARRAKTKAKARAKK